MPPTDPPQGENSPKPSGKPKARAGRKGPPSDVVGIEIGAGLAEGAPAVRLHRSPEGVLRIVAAGFVPVVSDIESIRAMPAEMRGPWSLPPAFRAPAAALAVTALYVVLGMQVEAVPAAGAVQWVGLIPYLLVIGLALAGVNVVTVLTVGILVNTPHLHLKGFPKCLDIACLSLNAAS